MIIGAVFLILKDYSFKETRRGIFIIQLIIAFNLLIILVSNLLPDNLRSIDINFLFQTLHTIGFGMNFAWFIIIEPIIFFGGLLFLLDIISEDYELKGYGKKTKIFLLINIGILLVLITLILFWKISTDSDPNVLTWFYNTIIIPNSLDIIQGIFWVILLSVLIVILSFAILDRKRGRSDNREYLKAIITWIVLYSIIFVILRGISAGFI
jgi:hypothetical protein